jgi:hypothetical protein
VYTSSVIAALACPSMRWTTLGFAPALMASDAGVDLIDERIEQCGRRGLVIQHPARLVQPGGIHQSVFGRGEQGPRMPDEVRANGRATAL